MNVCYVPKMLAAQIDNQSSSIPVNNNFKGEVVRGVFNHYRMCCKRTSSYYENSFTTFSYDKQNALNEYISLFVEMKCLEKTLEIT